MAGPATSRRSFTTRAQQGDATAQRRLQRTRAPLRSSPSPKGPKLTTVETHDVRDFRASTVRVVPGHHFWGPLIGLHPAKIAHHPLIAQSAAKNLTQDNVAPIGLDQRQAFAQAIQGAPTPKTFKALREAHSIIKTEQGKGSEMYRRSRLAYAIAAFKAGQLDVARKSLQIFTTDETPDDSLTLLAHITLADISLGEGVLTISSEREKAFYRALEILTSQIPILLGDYSPTDELYNLTADVYFHIVKVFMAYHYPESAKLLAKSLLTNFPDSEAAHQILAEDSPIAPFIKDGKIVDYQKISFWDRFCAGSKEFISRAKHDTNSGFWQSVTTGGFAGLATGTATTALLGQGIDFNSGLGWATAGGLIASMGVKAYKGWNAPETQQARHTGHSERNLDDFIKSSAIEGTKLLATYLLCGGAVPLLGDVNPDMLNPQMLYPDYDPSILNQETPTGYNIADRVHSKFGEIPGTFMQQHADGWASPVSLGTLQTFLYSAFGTWGYLLADHVHSLGFTDGLQSFTTVWAKETIYGHAFMNGIHWAQAVGGYLLNIGDHAQALTDQVSNSIQSSGLLDPSEWTWNGAHKLASGFYIGAAGLYSIAAIARPRQLSSLRQKFVNRHVTPDMTDAEAIEARREPAQQYSYAEFSLSIGAYLAAVSLGEAAGMETWDAMIVPGICYLTILRQHFMSGGKLSITEMDWTKIYMAGVVQLLYIYPGNLIRDGIKPQNVFEYFELGIAMAPFLVFGPGLLHGFFQGYNMERTVSSKVTKAPTTGLLGDAGSLMFGWDAWPAMLYKVFVKELGLSAFVSQTDREISGNEQQYRIFLAQIQKLSEMMGSNPDGSKQDQFQSDDQLILKPRIDLGPLKAKMIQDAETWQDGLIAADKEQLGGAWAYIKNTLKNPTPIERAHAALNLFFVRPKTRDIDIPDRIDCNDYRDVIFQFLMDESLAPKQLNGILKKVEVIFTDNSIKNKNDVKTNLAITLWAARFGPHAQVIRDFVESKYPQLKEIYSLSDDINFTGNRITQAQARMQARLARHPAYPPKQHKGKWAKAWFTANLSTGLSGAEKQVQNIYDTLTQAGRRWIRRSPVTGRAATENLSIFTAFMKSVRGGHNQDPTFATRPDAIFYQDILFRFLMDRSSEDIDIKAFLNSAQDILERTDDQLRRDVQHNLLLVIYAARTGPNGSLISQFIKENSWTLSFYGIDRNLTGPAQWNSIKNRTWFDKHLIWSSVSTDGINLNSEKSKPAQFQSSPDKTSWWQSFKAI